MTRVEAIPFAASLREAVRVEVTRLLTTRLQLQREATDHPEILRGEIRRPLVVLGLPRTGTTWLFELLALDPGARAPLSWEVAAPCPAPRLDSFATDPRIAQTQAGIDAMLASVPELATMHPFGATLPAECNAILQLHFASSNFWATYAVPDYIRWLTEAPAAAAMTTHRRVLQQLQWRGPKGRWVLKSPPYLLMLEELLAAYPDACLIQTHREPAKMVASLANMIRALRRARVPAVDALLEPKSIARSVLHHFGTALERGVASPPESAGGGALHGHRLPRSGARSGGDGAAHLRSFRLALVAGIRRPAAITHRSATPLGPRQAPLRPGGVRHRRPEPAGTLSGLPQTLCETCWRTDSMLSRRASLGLAVKAAGGAALLWGWPCSGQPDRGGRGRPAST